MLLEGIFLPLTTPFHPDGRLYRYKLEQNVARYAKTPAAGMLLLGDVAEADGLGDEETRTVLEAAMGATEDEKVMVAEVGRGSVLRTLAFAEAAAALGYDAIAVRAPACAAGLHAETMAFFLGVADRSPLPVVVAGLPEVELVAELAGHPQVMGAIAAEGFGELTARTAGESREVNVTSVFAAATGRMLGGGLLSAESLGGGTAVAVGRPAVKTRRKRVRFQVLASGTGTMLEAWGAGAVGAVPRLGSAAPQACCEVWQAFRDGDHALAEEKQDRVRKVAAMVEGRRGISRLKYGCDLNGYFGGMPRLPLLPLTGVERAEMERALGGLRN